MPTAMLQPRADSREAPAGVAGRQVVAVPPGKLGCTVRFSDDEKGAEITAVQPTSPVRGKVQIGERIVAIHGREVTKLEDLQTENDRERLAVVATSRARAASSGDDSLLTKGKETTKRARPKTTPKERTASAAPVAKKQKAAKKQKVAKKQKTDGSGRPESAPTAAATASNPTGEAAIQSLMLRQARVENEMRQWQAATQASLTQLQQYCHMSIHSLALRQCQMEKEMREHRSAVEDSVRGLRQYCDAKINAMNRSQAGRRRQPKGKVAANKPAAAETARPTQAVQKPPPKKKKAKKNAANAKQPENESVGPKPAELSKTPRTLADLWTEYKVGLDGNKPAERFSTNERNANSKVKQMYYRRGLVWQCIRQFVDAGFTAEEAFEEIGKVYGRDTTITKLIENIVDDRKTYKKQGGIHPSLEHAMITGTRAFYDAQLPARLSPNVRSLGDLWREYKVGLDGNTPAERFSTKERNSNRAMKQTYYRRNILWQFIQRMVNTGTSPEAAIGKIYSVYGSDTRNGKIAEMILADRKKYAEEGGVHPNLR